MTTIEDLLAKPEVLEKILSYMPQGQLLPLTVIKLFNEVISGSPKLMDRIVLKDFKEEVTRKYRIIHVQRSTEHVTKFVTENHASLRDIKFENLKMSTKYLGKILQLVSGTLEKFELRYVYFIVNCKATPIDLPKLRYLSIVIRDQFNIQPFLKCRLQEFYVDGACDPMSDDDKLGLKDFFRSQTDLKKLDCGMPEYTSVLLEDRELLTQIKFQLTDFSLACTSYDEGTQHSKNLMLFFENQKQLVDIGLAWVVCDTDLLLALKSSSVRSLTLCHPEIRDVVKIEQVHSLTISTFNYQEIRKLAVLLSCFPNVQELTLTTGNDNPPIPFGASVLIANEMPNLLMLTIYGRIEQTTFPTVDHMTLKFCNVETAVKLMCCNNQLSSLEIPRECEYVSFYEAARRGSKIQTITLA